VFLCQPCHAKSACRSEVHLDIVRKKCEHCGHMSNCFRCDPTAVVRRTPPGLFSSRDHYRNTKQITYRKIIL